MFNNLKIFLMEATKYAFGTLLDFTWPVLDIYQRIRPIIFLPFNIWFFFVSLPFRAFFFFINGLKPQTISSKDRSVEEKKSTETVIPSITVSNSETLRQRKVVVNEDRPFSWYSVSGSSKVEEPVAREGSILDEFKSQLEEIKLLKEQVVPKSLQSDQSDDFKGRLEEFERREKAAMEEKQRLESQLEELSNKYYANEKTVTLEKQRLVSQIGDLSIKHSSDEKAALEEKKQLESQLKELTEKYNTDEKALATFEAERTRFKQMIAVQQKKSFDFQQDIIGLKNELKHEHESLLKAQQELNSMKKQVKSEKNQARKDRKLESSTRSSTSTSTSSSSTSTPAPIVESKPVEEVKPAWSVQHHEKDFTEMVAAAQHEQQDTKSFSDVLKQSMEVKPAVEPTEEFTVVGGDLSNKHITLEKPSSSTETSAPVAETKPIEESKPAWHVPNHQADYTEMVASAQHEQQDHKSFSDVLKESLDVKPAESAKPTEEFTVVGGDLSNKHVTAN